MDRSRVIVVNSHEQAPQRAREAPRDDIPQSAHDAFMQEFHRQRAGARKLYQDGKCDLMSRPQCYASCEFSAYCSEWKYTVKTLF